MLKRHDSNTSDDVLKKTFDTVETVTSLKYGIPNHFFVSKKTSSDASVFDSGQTSLRRSSPVALSQPFHPKITWMTGNLQVQVNYLLGLS